MAAPEQSNPGFDAGGNFIGRTAIQWDQYFGAKTDAEGGSIDNGFLTGTTVVTGTLNLNGASVVGFDVGAFASLTIDNNLNVPPIGLSGSILQMVNADGQPTRAELDAFGNAALLTGRRSDGTNAVPTTLLSGDEVVRLDAWGYNGAAYVGPAAAVRLIATGTWSGVSNPAEVRISTTPTGSTGMVDRWDFASTGGLYALGATGGDQGVGTINAQDVFVNGASLTAPSVTLTGAVTGSGTSPITTSIAANAVTNAKLATMAGSGFKGNNSGGGAVVDLTAAQAATLIGAIASIPGFVNRLRNSTMVSWPNGTTGAIATAPTGSANIASNGWAVKATGAAGVWAQQATGQNGTYWSLKLTGTTSNTDITAAQRIGGSDAAVLAGQTVTFQAAIFNNTGAALVPTLATGFASAFENFGTVTPDLAATNLQSIADGTWGIVAYTFVVSASAINGYQVLVDFGAMNAGTKFVYLTAADLRVTAGLSTGLNASPPVPELPGLAFELQRNADYYNTSYVNGVAPGAVTGNGMVQMIFPTTLVSGNTAGMMVSFPRMRVAPSISTYSPVSGGAGVMYDLVAASDVASAIADIGDASCFVYGNGNMAGNSAYLDVYFHWKAYADFW